MSRHHSSAFLNSSLILKLLPSEISCPPTCFKPSAHLLYLNVAYTEIFSVDVSWIFSPPVTPRAHPNLSSLNARLNSPAESAGHLPPAKVPTIEELNQPTSKLVELQLSAEESKDNKLVIHEA
jgi:hypothetical protein